MRGTISPPAPSISTLSYSLSSRCVLAVALSYSGSLPSIASAI